jgi:MFS family permease
MASLRTFTPLRRQQFRRIFAGQVVSGLGDWFDCVALLTLVAYVWRSGAFALAGLTIAMAVPWIVVAPFAGVWADRLPPRALMIGADLVRAAIVLGYLIADSLPVLLLLVMCKSAVSTLFTPAEQKAIRLAAPPDELHSAVALTTFARQATKVVGPALGGLLVAAVGPWWAFAVDAATFVASAVILVGLRLTGTDGIQQAREPRRFRTELHEGLIFLLRSRRLRVALGGMTATIFLVFTFDTLSPLTLAALGIESSMLGFAIAGIGFGAVIGTIFIGQWGDRIQPSMLMSASQVVAGTLVALVGLAALTHAYITPLAWLAGMILTGAAAAGILMSFSVTLQRETPQALLGRVSSAAEVVPTIMQLAAPPIGAAIAVGFGVGWVLALAGACLAMIGVLTALPSWRSGFSGLAAVAEPDSADVAAHAAPVPHPAPPRLSSPPGQTSFLL